MVASDTVVGLVGAGILLVALAGVFVIESKDTSKSRDLGALVYRPVAAGTGGSTPAESPDGDNPGNLCLMPTPHVCRGAYTNLTITAINLPLLSDTSGLHYVAALTGGGAEYVFGELEASGATYTIDSHTTTDTAQADRNLVITLSSRADDVSDILLYQYGWGASVTLAESTVTARLAPEGVTATATFKDVDDGMQVEVTLDNAQNRSGLDYWAWLVQIDDAGASTYTALGNFSASEKGAFVNGTFSGPVKDKSFGDFSAVLITLEANAAPRADGDMPGFPVLRKDLKA